MIITNDLNQYNRFKEMADETEDMSVKAVLMKQALDAKRRHDAINRKATSDYWARLNAKYEQKSVEVEDCTTECTIDAPKRGRKKKEQE